MTYVIATDFTLLSQRNKRPQFELGHMKTLSPGSLLGELWGDSMGGDFSN